MCGIAGFIDAGPGRTALPVEVRADVMRMADTMAHRGPDDSAAWIDHQAGVAMGFRRLAILDLSPAGRQPMVSRSQRYVIALNGEIYNFRELRETLESDAPVTLHGTSDTEVLLAAIDRWGVAAAVERCAGMFALAVWDRQQRQLHLCRDRIGEKPLYYAMIGNAVLFASEIQALRAHRRFRGEIDRDALAVYFRHNYIPAPHSIYRGVRKLLPGTILTVTLNDDTTLHAADPVAYWSARELIAAAPDNMIAADDETVLDRFDQLLRNTIRREMIADVPLGAFLSGGVDSSLVVALMQAQSTRPVRTFSIGFHERKYNEAHHAKAVADHLGTDHTELYVTDEQLQQAIPLMPAIYGEPYADSSQIPMYLVAKLAREHVTVSLSGDGGDELFCGYRRYTSNARRWHRAARWPRPIRNGFGRMLQWAAPAAALLRGSLAKKMERKGRFLCADAPATAYRNFISLWGDPCQCVLGATEPPTAFTDPGRTVAGNDFLRGAMSADLLSYLPDDLLVKVDRATMAVSLESRAPLVDHPIAEFSFRLPEHMLTRGGTNKWLLRNLLYRYVPRPLVDRRKMGFSPPVDQWLRGPLREWAEDLLAEDRLRREGFFDPGPIRRRLAEHQQGTCNWGIPLWIVLMFQAWHQEETTRTAALPRAA